MHIPNLFLDLDNTITRSRQCISPEMANVLQRLAERTNITIVSGAAEWQIILQLDAVASCVAILAQNGNVCLNKDGKILWNRKLSTNNLEIIASHVEAIKLASSYPTISEIDMVEMRGAQVSLSLVGHHAPIEEKERFDPTGQLRARLLKETPLNSNEVEVRIGGTTCLDYSAKGQNKGFNISMFMLIQQWWAWDCLYIGDQLFPDGNDESVCGWCPTWQVENPGKTLSILKGYLRA